MAPSPLPRLREPPLDEAMVAPAPRPVPVPPERDTGIDALRGFAVFAMVGANMVAFMLDEPYPFWLRVYTSLAAPAFILLAGFMVGRAHVRRPASLLRHLKRMLGLLLVASLVDVLLWGDEPFASFDVLYLIALVPPASHLTLRLPGLARLAVVAAILLATPLLQGTVGYGAEAADSGWERVRALFVDGWFPVFPWLGVGVFGTALGAFQQESGRAVFARKVTWLGALLLLAGGGIWWLTAPEHPTSGGFAELFYPPTLGVLFATLGFVVLLLVPLSGRVVSRAWRALAVYGRVALAMYIVHLAIIAFALERWFAHESLVTFGIVYLAHAVLLWWLALAIRRLWPAPRAFWARLLLGG